MGRSLMLDLDEECVALAERQARLTGATMLEVLKRELAAVVQDCRVRRTRKVPATYRIDGVVYLADHPDLPRILAGELRRRLEAAEWEPQNACRL